ncbi:hypothetical protein OG349_31835 [Streptomyces sp. NBC_01317]|uniref:hypothetical protein n=1 Tax=Streptomyces sp. NBC_01317 TaxID=2903822 RepID=UPI002E11DD6C|nr:hypothetical protein OG349_31835 [Streptomyces sp. NBC_01317]
MSRWSSALHRRRGRSAPERAPGNTAASPAGAGRQGAGGAPPVEDIDGLLLVRSVEDDSFPLATLAEVAHAVSVDADIVTVMVGSAAGGGPADDDLWTRLGALLDSLRSTGVGRVRLVMSGAGDDQPGRPCVARRIADAWELEVLAPDGAVLITPGGGLFVHGDSRTGGRGWWRFAPGEAPRKLGPRAPAPAWQEALGRVPARTTGGCVVEQIPAGVVMRPAGAPTPDLDDLCFAVPADFERPTVVVGAPRAEDVAADEVAAVLSALPVGQRSRVRLAPGGRRDLLRLGHAVAGLLGSEVEVLTGLPLLADHAPPGTAPRPTLVGADGAPSWQPFVSSVTCGPADAEGRFPAPRLLGSHPPAWIPRGTQPGTVVLTDRWQATVTRAGLALWERDGPRPPLAALPVDPDRCAVELGAPGRPLDNSVLPALSRLLAGLGSDVRARTTLLVRGKLMSGEGELRRLAAEHGVPGIRYVTAGPPRVPGPARRPAPAPRPVAGAAPAGPPMPPVRVSSSSGPTGQAIATGSGPSGQPAGPAVRGMAEGAAATAAGAAGGGAPGGTARGAGGTLPPRGAEAGGRRDGTSGHGPVAGATTRAPGDTSAGLASPGRPVPGRPPLSGSPSGEGADHAPAPRAGEAVAGALGHVPGGPVAGTAGGDPARIERPEREAPAGERPPASPTGPAPAGTDPAAPGPVGAGPAVPGPDVSVPPAGARVRAPDAVAPAEQAWTGPAASGPVAAGPAVPGSDGPVSPAWAQATDPATLARATSGPVGAGPAVPGSDGPVPPAWAQAPDPVASAAPARTASAPAGSGPIASDPAGAGPAVPGPDVPVPSARVQAPDPVIPAAPDPAGTAPAAFGPAAAGPAVPGPDGPVSPAWAQAPDPVTPAAPAPAGTDPAASGPVGTGSAVPGPDVPVPPAKAQVPDSVASAEGAWAGPVASGPVAAGPATPGADVSGPSAGARVRAPDPMDPAVSGPAVPGSAVPGPGAPVSPARAQASDPVAPDESARVASGPAVFGPAGPGPVGPGPAPSVPDAPDPVTPAPPEPVRRASGPSAATDPARSAVPLPFSPGHVSSVAERVAFRDFAGSAWEGHAAAVSRVLTRMPALRGHELDAARTDLIAAHAYLTTEEGPLHPRELIRDLCTGEGRLLPYAGCLASALRRLPSYRGVALRGGDVASPEPAVGALLQEPGPISALAKPSALPAGATVRYAIWSITGRKVRQLLDRPAGSPDAYDEIVFVPGTGFRVLAVRTVPAGPSVVLLRELPGNATAYMDGAEELSGLDLKALAHLEAALATKPPAGEGQGWPERCAGPVGQGAG